MKHALVAMTILGISLYAIYMAVYMNLIIEAKHRISYTNTMLSQFLYKQHLNIPIRLSTKEAFVKYIDESILFSNKRLNKIDAKYYTEIFQLIKERINKIPTD